MKSNGPATSIIRQRHYSEAPLTTFPWCQPCCVTVHIRSRINDVQACIKPTIFAYFLTEVHRKVCLQFGLRVVRSHMPDAMFHHDGDFISIYFAYQIGTLANHKVHIRLRIVIHRSETTNNRMPIKLFLSLLTDKCH